MPSKHVNLNQGRNPAQQTSFFQPHAQSPAQHLNSGENVVQELDQIRRSGLEAYSDRRLADLENLTSSQIDEVRRSSLEDYSNRRLTNLENRASSEIDEVRRSSLEAYSDRRLADLENPLENRASSRPTLFGESAPLENPEETVVDDPVNDSPQINGGC